MKRKSTEKLLNVLNKFESKTELDKYLDYSSLQESNFNMEEYILEVCKSKGYNKSDIIKNASIHRTYGYQILSGKKSPSRNKLIQISIGNKFTLDQANRTLTLAKLGILYAKDQRDSIIIYALNNNLDIMETNFILNEHALKLLDE